MESGTLSTLGGLLGIGAGYAGGATISSLPWDFRLIIPPTTVALAFCFSAGVGIVFGVYPAMRAARLDPIESLRYE